MSKMTQSLQNIFRKIGELFGYLKSSFGELNLRNLKGIFDFIVLTVISVLFIMGLLLFLLAVVMLSTVWFTWAGVVIAFFMGLITVSPLVVIFYPVILIISSLLTMGLLVLAGLLAVVILDSL